MQLRSGQDEAILLPGRFLISCEIFARLDVRWRHDAIDAFTIDKAVQELPYGTARWKDCGHAATEAMGDPGYIDTAAPGISLRRRTAHFSRRFEAADIDENVDGRIDRERDDIGHVRRPLVIRGLVSQTGPLPNEIGIFWLRCHIADFRKLCGTAMRAGAFHLFVTMTAEPSRA
jgi:hypothetical protein